MSESKICPICGGYIGNAILHATLTVGSSVQSITFCPGHSTTDAELASHFPVAGESGPEQLHIMCTGVGREMVTLPQGSSVYPTSHLQREETLWRIVQKVAETDSTDYNDGGPAWTCPFCNGYQTDTSRLRNEPFPHQPTCIVTKARELLEWRKAQPHIEFTFPTEAIDAEAVMNAIVHWKGLIHKEGEE